MFFLIIGRDGKHDGALQHRISVRPQHIKLAEEMYKSKKLIYAVAMLENNSPVGSVMIFNFVDQAELDQYLQTEPYIKEKVWQDVEVKACQPPPFINL